MKSLNKSLLAAAVIGVIALPGLSSAATLSFIDGKQLTYARDLFVTDDTMIEVQDNLRLRAQASDNTRVAGPQGVKAGERVTIKVTLTNGARFDTTSNAETLVLTFVEGHQTRQGVAAVDHGGADATTPINYISGTAAYSGNGQELTFSYRATKDAVTTTANNEYFLELNSSQIRNLVSSLGAGGSVDAEITAQNKDGAQVLAARAIIARSVWGVDVRSINPFPNANKRIDVGSLPTKKTLFSHDGKIGSSNDSTDAKRLYFNAGGFELDIVKTSLTGNTGTEFVNNYNAVQPGPLYNIVGTAKIGVTVTGLNLSAFIGRAWLDSSANCDTADTAGTARTNLNITAAEPGIAVTENNLTANHPLFLNVTNPIPATSRVYVCLAAGAGTTASPSWEIVPQPLSGSVSIDYDLPTQRLNPPDMPFTLQPLELNGSTIIFQNVNPAGNSTAESFLRLTNNNAEACPVVIDAKDDLGRHSGEVRLTLAAHASEQVNINVLESGNDPRFTNTDAGFRDGAGKWYVRVTAECEGFVGSALNRNTTTGVVTNLTPERRFDPLWLTPTVPVP